MKRFLLAACVVLCATAASAQNAPIGFKETSPTAGGLVPVSPTTPLPVTGSSSAPSFSVVMPSAASAVALSANPSTSAESSRVVKASAGNLYALTLAIGATSGNLMLFDATSAPADGAVVPKWCFPVTSNGTNGGVAVSWLPGPPMAFATGITAVFSSNSSCLTKAASATALFYPGFK